MSNEKVQNIEGSQTKQNMRIFPKHLGSSNCPFICIYFLWLSCLLKN